MENPEQSRLQEFDQLNNDMKDPLSYTFLRLLGVGSILRLVVKGYQQL